MENCRQKWAEFANGADMFDSMNGVVMGQSLLIKRPMSEEEGISEEAVREELSRILESSMFIQSDRLSRFLRFTVDATLAGEAEMLKEYLIGTEVYDRKPPYHPNMDSIVRSEARRLRSKLKEYYESVGKDDSVLIYYRLGSYAPVFRPNRRDDGNDNLKENGRSELFLVRQGIRTAVLPFLDASRSDLSGACAQIITDELIHEIGRTEGFRVSAASSTAPLVAQDLDLPSVARKLDVQIVFEGSVREDNNQLHVTSRVVNAEGFLIWSERFETEPDIQSLFKVSERIASSLISRVRPEKASIRKKIKKASYKFRSSENGRSDRTRLSSRG
jgi:TolB-like protein